MPERPYANVWQKMLLEEAEENGRARDRRDLDDYEDMLKMAGLESGLPPEPQPRATPSPAPKLDYHVGALPDFGSVTQPPPRLPYDFDLEDPLAGPGGYQVDDIVVNGRRHQRGTAYSSSDGIVMRGMTGWQNPNDHNRGLGWRTWIERPDGSRIGYGHLDPSSTLPEGTQVRRGDAIGRYGDSTNGRSTGPHVHVQAFDRNGRLIAPPEDDPFGGRGRRLRRFRERDAMHRGARYPNGHQGDDWIEE
ncbi:M23 family metallopeptidase [Rhizorhabdus dicambivorans]|uniref:M23 family metallopeptidase n=1 Tax=Rhizorhabdus dicambivorans TaxID=1850238 RepID=UPI001112C20A|nr:M23 family metallopeptidase [Rhizorhabdus dicambivorans]